MRVASLAITEEAEKLIWATRADFSSISVPPIPGRGSRPSSSTLGAYDFEQVRNQSEYLRLVSIVEAYIDACSSQQFDLRAGGRDMFLQNLARQAQELTTKGWEERKATFKLYHGISLGSCARWKEIDAAREVRNGIAHGLGKLTTRQQNKRSKSKIASVGIRLRGQELIVDHVALKLCAGFAVEFVNDVDRQLVHRF